MSEGSRSFGSSRGSGRLEGIGLPTFWLGTSGAGFPVVVGRLVAIVSQTSGRYSMHWLWFLWLAWAWLSQMSSGRRSSGRYRVSDDEVMYLG